MVRQGLEIKHKRNYHWVSVVLWLFLFTLLIAAAWIGYRYFTTGELPQVLSVGALTANPTIDETTVSENQIASHTTASDEPRYISIPLLHVEDARVFKTDVDSNNLLAFPANIHDVGWYQKSAHVGQGYGVVLLTGHNKGVTATGAFTKIGTLSLGSEVTVKRGDDKVFTYTVEGVERMTVEEMSQTGMKSLLQPIDETRENLVLVTTDGNWVPRIRQFESRTIVRAVAKE